MTKPTKWLLLEVLVYYEGTAEPAFKAKIGEKKHLEVYLHIKVSFKY